MTRSSLSSGLAALAVGAAMLLAPVEASAGSFSLSFAPKGEAAEVAAKSEKFLRLVEAAKRNASGKSSGNLASVMQNGTGNAANIFQRGRGHSATIAQNGNNNRMSVLQFGRNTTANVVQTGNGRTGYLIQGGW